MKEIALNAKDAHHINRQPNKSTTRLNVLVGNDFFIDNKYTREIYIYTIGESASFLQYCF